jgi:nitrate reductase NapAB chaperone NapD
VKVSEDRVVVSGILVGCDPLKMDSVQARLDAFDWAQVHHRADDGRMVMTLEATGTDQSMDRLREIQQVEDVLMAEMVEYYFEDEVQMRPLADGQKGIEELNTILKKSDFKRKSTR